MKLLSILTIALFINACSLIGSTPIITITTKSTAGQNITFKFATTKVNTEIKIDYGDGVLVEYIMPDHLKTIKGTVQGENIKIHGKKDALTTFYCSNEKLTSLQFAKNTALKELYCFQNALTSLDVTKCPALEKLYCYNNQLPTLDLTNNLAMEDLSCGWNQLTTLNLTNHVALTDLYCAANQLITLDITQNTLLEKLHCHQNKLTNLDLTHNNKLSKVQCSKNQLTTLDLSKNTLLKSLDCTNNQLKTLELTNNPTLNYLYCDKNQLTSLDLTHNTVLKYFNCNDNQLSSLKGIENTALTDYFCRDNKLTFSTIPLPKPSQDEEVYVFCWPQSLVSIDKTIAVNTSLDLSNESNINNTKTSFVWKTIDGHALKEDEDYMINNGITTFIKAQPQPVFCQMENNVFPNLILKTTEIVVGKK